MRGRWTCRRSLKTYFRRSGYSWRTQAIVAWNTFSSLSTFSWLLAISSSTSWNGSRRNSSVPITSWKFWRANLCDRLWSSLHACVSAKFLMPRQLVGWSWRIKNLQQAWAFLFVIVELSTLRRGANNPSHPIKSSSSDGVIFIAAIMFCLTLDELIIRSSTWSQLSSEGPLWQTAAEEGRKPEGGPVSLFFSFDNHWSSAKLLSNKSLQITKSYW